MMQQYTNQLQSFNEFFPTHFREINNLIRKADFNNDPYVKEFGLNISHNLMEVRGRVLPPPKIQYGGEFFYLEVLVFDREPILWSFFFRGGRGLITVATRLRLKVKSHF